MYTIRDHSLESITCDDNGAYIRSNSNKKIFHVEIEGSELSAKTVHESNGKYFYKEKDGRFYVNHEVDSKTVFEIERYYRWNKSIPQLKRSIYRIRNILATEYHPYTCVVYSLHGNQEENVQEIEILPHGNSKHQADSRRPYFRTEASVLEQEDTLLSSKRSPQEVYEIVLKEAGGPLQSSSISQEPRNLKQIQNRKNKLNKNSRNSSTQRLLVSHTSLLHIQKNRWMISNNFAANLSTLVYLVLTLHSIYVIFG